MLQRLREQLFGAEPSDTGGVGSHGQKMVLDGTRAKATTPHVHPHHAHTGSDASGPSTSSNAWRRACRPYHSSLQASTSAGSYMPTPSGSAETGGDDRAVHGDGNGATPPKPPASASGVESLVGNAVVVRGSDIEGSGVGSPSREHTPAGGRTRALTRPPSLASLDAWAGSSGVDGALASRSAGERPPAVKSAAMRRASSSGNFSTSLSDDFTLSNAHRSAGGASSRAGGGVRPPLSPQVSHSPQANASDATMGSSVARSPQRCITTAREKDLDVSSVASTDSARGPGLPEHTTRASASSARSDLGASVRSYTGGNAVRPEETPFLAAMERDTADMKTLRELSWHGCPARLRLDVWYLLTGHWHPQRTSRAGILARKRQEYVGYVQRGCGRGEGSALLPGLADGGLDRSAAPEAAVASLSSASCTSLPAVRSPSGAPCQGSGPASLSGTPLLPSKQRQQQAWGLQPVPSPAAGASVGSGVAGASRLRVAVQATTAEAQIIRQIRKDVPRMSGGVAWLQHPRVTASIERILFLWSLRHPACGYVQGMNDFVVPFLAVVLARRYCPTMTVSELYSYDRGTVAERFGSWTGEPALSVHSVSASTTTTPGATPTVVRSVDASPPPLSAFAPRSLVDAPTAASAMTPGSTHEALSVSGRGGHGNEDEDEEDGPFARASAVDGAASVEECTWLTAVDGDDVWVGELEADAYWLTSYVLSVMQDNFTSNQSGITNMVKHLAVVLAAADRTLFTHLTEELHVDVSLFAFRWINCLLLRELTITQSLRLLDTYLSDETRNWSVSHVFVCCAVLLRMSALLMSIHDFGLALHTLQNPPTERLTTKQINEIISEAYVLQCLYGNLVGASGTN